MRSQLNPVMALLLLSWYSGVAYSQTSSDSNMQALEEIRKTAGVICRDVPIEGSSSSFELSGQGKAELDLLIKKLGKAGISGSSNYDASEYNNVLQQDLQSIILKSQDCKLGVFTKLADILLTPRKTVPPLDEHDNEPLSITSPAKDATVDQVAIVEGSTELKTLYHYIVVAPQTGNVWVTDGPLLITKHGHWTGRAQLGTGDLGHGETFLIHVVATKSPLSHAETTMQSVNGIATAIATITVKRK